MEKKFKDAGYHDVVYRRPKPKPSTLQPLMMDWMWAMEEAYEFVVKRFPEKLEMNEECRKLREGPVMQEMTELKAGIDFAMQRCIGRKPIS